MPADRLQIPILKTHRLSMEPISFSYSQEMFELWSDAEVCRFSGAVKDYDGNIIATPAATLADSDSIIDFWLKAADDGWGCRWAVLLAGTMDAFAGIIGFNSLENCSEIAFHLLPRHWGKGIMTEASQAAIEWRRSNGASEIEAFIEVENAPSIALARRLGMTATGTFFDGAQRYRMSL